MANTNKKTKKNVLNFDQKKGKDDITVKRTDSFPQMNCLNWLQLLQ